MISTKRISRKQRRCDQCRHLIEVGEEYYRHSLPPHTEPNYSDHWQSLVMCGRYTSDCKDYWVVDSIPCEEQLVP